MAKFQIREGDFGVALYDSASAVDALVAFAADAHKPEIRKQISTGADGVPVIVIDGVEYRAVGDDADH